jgi:hypothetical protein
MQPHQPSRSQPVTVITPSVPSLLISGSASDHPSVLSDRFARFEYRQPYPSGIEPDPAKKVYCTHWIRTGECAFTSVGCKYKHEMPHVEKLRELGFTLGTPKWFQEKAAIAARGPTWIQRRLAERISSQEAIGVATAPRVSSTLRSRSTDMRGSANERDTTRGVPVRPSLKSTLTPPLEPQKLSVPSVSSIPDLLIDIDDSSLEDSGPSSSAHSSASSACSIAHEVLKNNNKKWGQGRQAVRCCSPLSLTSESEDEVTVLKSSPKRSTTSRKLAARTAAPSHKTGLTASKHAAANGKECHVVRSSHASSSSHKNSTARAVGALSKTHRLKQKTGQPAAGKMRLVSKTAAPTRVIVL